jgi:Ca2+-binding RTX toxin-like protein
VLTLAASGSGIADAAGNLLAGDTTDAWTTDTTAPTLTIAPDGTNTNAGAITFTFQFGEPVAGFAADAVSVTGGTAGQFTTLDGDTYTLEVAPSADGDVTVEVATGVAHDAAGNGNAADSATVTSDRTAPTVTIDSAAPDPTNASPIQVTVNFSEEVSGFALGDVTANNGLLANLVGSGATYTFDVTPLDQGPVTVDIAAGVAQDSAGNGNTAADQLSRTYKAPFDISVVEFTTDPNQPGVLRIEYVVSDHVAVAFDLRFCASADDVFDGTDVRCGPSITVSSFADRSIGDHEQVIDGGDYAEILTDASVSYFLAAAVPSIESLDTTTTNNWTSFVGIFHVAGGPALVRGGDATARTAGDGDDTVTITQDDQTTNINIHLNGTSASLATEAVTEVRVFGLGGNDKVLADATVSKPVVAHGGPGDDLLTGGAGTDELFGGDGDDSLNGGSGDDSLHGDAGNDSIAGGDGDDSLDGGGGTDQADYGNAPSAVMVDLAAGTARGDGADVLAAIEDVLGSAHADVLLGDALANMLIGAGGSDTIRGGAGDDVLGGGDDADNIHGGPGNDSIMGGGGDDTLSGDDQDDAETDGNDTMFGGEGNDFLCGHGGDDELNGDVGNDTLVGHGGNDVLRGGAGDDLLGGEAGNDQLFGDEGSDTLSGGDGPDTLEGGAGADLVAAIPGQDTVVQEAAPATPQKKRGRGKKRGKGKSGNDRIVFGR